MVLVCLLLPRGNRQPSTGKCAPRGGCRNVVTVRNSAGEGTGVGVPAWAAFFVTVSLSGLHLKKVF